MRESKGPGGARVVLRSLREPVGKLIGEAQCEHEYQRGQHEQGCLCFCFSFLSTPKCSLFPLCKN